MSEFYGGVRAVSFAYFSLPTKKSKDQKENINATVVAASCRITVAIVKKCPETKLKNEKKPGPILFHGKFNLAEIPVFRFVPSRFGRQHFTGGAGNDELTLF